MQKSSLEKLLLSDKEARNFGFIWPNVEMILEQVLSELEEVKMSIKHQEGIARIQEEIGDLLHTVISLCLFCGFDLEDTFDKAEQKFTKRFKELQQLCKEEGYDSMKNLSIEKSFELWGRAKQNSYNMAI